MSKVLPLPTTNETVAYALKRSLIAAGAAKPAGSTWGDFKAACEAMGITDNTPLAFIEYGVKQGGLGHVIRDDHDDPDGVGVREL